ncbi:hypothetical protein PV10_05239 [Exophiala mesophila]|uniref:Uncharacterized protein n=1 Tax=Exophiala mesophila TaxID=212818 RepID=A0A0D2A517_EXOME|nr:uncharacterized protein PV10_05239 [Exophiala mesophila]KIV94083.1 hypothetical protein PV10_05239 [Exophiala mesophila]
MQCSEACQQKELAKGKVEHRPQRPKLWINTKVTPVHVLDKAMWEQPPSTTFEDLMDVDESDAQEPSEEYVQGVWTEYGYEEQLAKGCPIPIPGVSGEDESSSASQESTSEYPSEYDLMMEFVACEDDLANERANETMNLLHWCPGPECCPPSPRLPLTSAQRDAAMAKRDEMNDFVNRYLPELEAAQNAEYIFCEAASKLSRHIETVKGIQDAISGDDRKLFENGIEIERRLGTWRCDKQQVGLSKTLILTFRDNTEIELTEEDFDRLPGRMTTMNPNVKSIHTMQRATLKEPYNGS